MPRIGITMGCPVGVGPEIILRYCESLNGEQKQLPVVIGDIDVLSFQAEYFGMAISCVPWLPGDRIAEDQIPVYCVSQLDPSQHQWGKPDRATDRAMAAYIESAVTLTMNGTLDGIATCPITKTGLQQAGHSYPGHTEMLADLTGSTHFTMMMAGDRLRVTLATIHCSFTDIIKYLDQNIILDLIRLTHSALQHDFAIAKPSIAVAGLNPHAGESGLFGREESEIIAPAVAAAQAEGIDALGPFPPDTVFFQAARGKYDTVVCMYHDQGLIPFKLLHFSDGVNVTLGLPIVRTSVDHGTAYDIAGKGVAEWQSLAAAVALASAIAINRRAGV